MHSALKFCILATDILFWDNWKSIKKQRKTSVCRLYICINIYSWRIKIQLLYCDFIFTYHSLRNSWIIKSHRAGFLIVRGRDIWNYGVRCILSESEHSGNPRSATRAMKTCLFAERRSYVRLNADTQVFRRGVGVALCHNARRQHGRQQQYEDHFLHVFLSLHAIMFIVVIIYIFLGTVFTMLMRCDIITVSIPYLLSNCIVVVAYCLQKYE